MSIPSKWKKIVVHFTQVVTGIGYIIFSKAFSGFLKQESY